MAFSHRFSSVAFLFRSVLFHFAPVTVRIAISVCAQGIMNASLGAEDGLQLLYNFMVLDRSRYESASISKAAQAFSEQISNLLIMHKLGFVLDKGKGKG